MYDVSGAWFLSDAKDTAESIYKIAKQQMLNYAKEINILAKTEENARTIFKPFLENLIGKKVRILVK